MTTSLPKSQQWKLGTLALLPYDIDVSHNATVAGTLAVTGTTIFTGAITATGGLKVAVATVAAAGSTVTDAAQLIAGLNIVTGADGTKGVKLPAAPSPGTVVFIKGTTSAVLKVWPDAAATINAIASNGAMSFPSGVIPAILVASSATQWYTFPLLPS